MASFYGLQSDCTGGAADLGFTTGDPSGFITPPRDDPQNRLVVEPPTGEQSHGSILQRKRRLAESHRNDDGDLHVDRRIPVIREVWPHESTSSRGGLGCQQYCRGVRKINARGVHTVPRACTGIELRSGNAIGDCRIAWIRCGAGEGKSSATVRRCEPIAKFLDESPPRTTYPSLVPLSLCPFVPWRADATGIDRERGIDSSSCSQ